MDRVRVPFSLSFPLVRIFRVEGEQDRKEVCDLRQFAKSRDAQVLEMEWVNYRAPRYTRCN